MNFMAISEKIPSVGGVAAGATVVAVAAGVGVSDQQKTHPRASRRSATAVACPSQEERIHLLALWQANLSLLRQGVLPVKNGDVTNETRNLALCLSGNLGRQFPPLTLEI